jgi:biotin-[acetyl-CoA-carboxylase] ligase BirA-like protein
MAEKIFVEQTGSTNDDLLIKSGIGTHIYTPLQTSGKGRRNRKWESIERCYAGSWIVAEGSRINPGLIQLAGGLAVLNTVGNSKLKLKWPNDILIEDRKLCGILVEGRTSQNSTTAVIGIGINLETENHIIDGNKISTLSEIGEFDLHELDRRLNCELASLLEERQDIPPIDFESIRSDVLNHIRLFGKPRYKGVVYEKFDLNDKGELVFDSIIIDDGEEVDWI